MSTRQAEASRVNGAKSKGPVTEEGKRAASRNATKHGIFCRQVLLDCEDKEAFEEFVTGMSDYWKPVGPMESLLFDRIVAEGWRLQRLTRIERELMDGRFAEMQAFLNQKDQADDEYMNDDEHLRPRRRARLGPAVAADLNATMFERLRHYEARIERSMYRAIAELRELQAPRTAEESRRVAASRARVESIEAAMKQLLQNIADRIERLAAVDEGLAEAETAPADEEPEEAESRRAWISKTRWQRQADDATLNNMRQQHERLSRRLAEQRAILAADEAGEDWPEPAFGGNDEGRMTNDQGAKAQGTMLK